MVVAQWGQAQPDSADHLAMGEAFDLRGPVAVTSEGDPLDTDSAHATIDGDGTHKKGVKPCDRGIAHERSVEIH
jgi:hypothetical protein